ncbi:MAG: hypothetical protein COA47_02790 [Robiginitomaculum sp.]|nr:MAG: hypothetical protein COA47_02790 [Robiginitomaculum sp.]
MSKVIKRKPDFRKIQTNRTYTIPEAAKAIDVTTGTIYNWIRRGLPVLEGRGLTLIQGAVFKKWLADKWAKRKQPCKPSEIFCFGCQKPAIPKPGSVSLIARNDKIIRICAKCSVCATNMNRTASRAKLEEIRFNFGELEVQELHLNGYSFPNAKSTSCRVGSHGREI